MRALVWQRVAPCPVRSGGSEPLLAGRSAQCKELFREGPYVIVHVGLVSSVETEGEELQEWQHC